MTARKNMSFRVAMAVLLLGSVLGAQTTAPSGTQPSEPKKEEKPPFQLETFYLAIMSRGNPYDGNQVSQLAKDEHSYWQALADRGDLILGGPTTEVKDTIAAVFIYRAKDKLDAERIAQTDPIARQKLWMTLVLPWATQKDFLHPLKKYDPATNYFLGFLRRGPKAGTGDEAERQRVQDAHLKNIGRLHDMGKLTTAGPFMEDTDLRGIFVFKTATLEEANELTNTDPAVQAGRLRIELHPWTLPAEAFAK